MTAADWKRLAVGDLVLVDRGGALPPVSGRIADKVSEHPGIYSVLIAAGHSGKRPLLFYADISGIRRKPS